jgi:hypothetical protein
MKKRKFSKFDGSLVCSGDGGSQRTPQKSFWQYELLAFKYVKRF